VSSKRNGPTARRSPASIELAASILRLGLPMSNVAVASCAPLENSSAGLGARSTCCAVMLATRLYHGRFWITPKLALFGVKLGLCGEVGPTLAGSGTTSKVSEGNVGVVPLRLTCSMRPATWALVVSLNLNSLKMYPATRLLLFGFHRPLRGLPGSSG